MNSVTTTASDRAQTCRPGVNLDPFVYDLARPARAVGPETRLGEAAEILRVSPYRAIAVVYGPGPILLGLATERGIADALLAARTSEERAQVRMRPVGSVMEPPEIWATGALRASDAAMLFDRTGAETLPVVDMLPGGAGLHYLGLLSRSDLVQELMRPFRPPMIGGLATPTGVYLTTGAVSGGAGTLALIGSGLALWASHLAATFALHPVQQWASHIGGSAGALIGGDGAAALATMVLYLTIIRLSPIAGYHAAEHQVVHAVERGEPLLVESVRAMPRVHPRCGTNLVAGLTLFGLLGTILTPLISRVAPAIDDLGWVIAGLIALTSWRPVGAWLQQYVTTRPATDTQITSGIRAAREVLDRHGRRPGAVPRPHQRLWRMGFLQLMAGYVIGYAVLFALLHVCPPLARGLSGWLPLNDLY